MRLKFLFEVTLPVFIVFWGAFMIYGAWFSDTGYRARNDLRTQEAQVQAQLAALTAKRRWMENRAALLDPEELDPDMVDERIRNVLGYADERDIVITRKGLKQAIAMMQDKPGQKPGNRQKLANRNGLDRDGSLATVARDVDNQANDNYAANIKDGAVSSLGQDDPLANIIAQSLIQ